MGQNEYDDERVNEGVDGKRRTMKMVKKRLILQRSNVVWRKTGSLVFFLIWATCAYGNVASYYPVERTEIDSLEIDRGSSFRQCGFDCVEQDGH